MQHVRLHGDTKTTQLGYGCASLMAQLDRRTSRRLLDAAYDAGVRHFDVARSYGYGQAEQIVGELWRRHDDITVTTKCGIQPPPHGLVLRLKPLLRKIVAFIPSLRAVARAQASQMVRRGTFDVEQTAASLRRSMDTLNTERVDLLLLHECTAADLSPSLLEWLQLQVADGRIGSFGTATSPQETKAALATPFARTVQVPHTLSRPGAPEPQALADRGVILHSVLGDLLQAHDVLEQHPELAADVHEVAEAVSGDARDVGSLLLAATAAARPEAVVLFASRRVDRIAAAVRAVETGLPAGTAPVLQRLTAAVTRRYASTSTGGGSLVGR